jgi:hypothetical protein
MGFSGHSLSQPLVVGIQVSKDYPRLDELTTKLFKNKGIEICLIKSSWSYGLMNVENVASTGDSSCGDCDTVYCYCRTSWKTSFRGIYPKTISQLEWGSTWIYQKLGISSETRCGGYWPENILVDPTSSDEFQLALSTGTTILRNALRDLNITDLHATLFHVPGVPEDYDY